ncbi:hypothetical protein BKA82DRAFT_824631 [Pisolithus tinctorius]|uniref:Uncharacterized protein n=1 Tax=Pisolithus tinctorius Marx 270 TaxID=870435 RepID=A0A0C3NCK2_PISTI|nr:hypothetical protein BKA82DRAFT_824631 [Pisolithus tinctorius]KIN98824.1 hypothetical protein M404DRAFT_824631 [Pisolithus tinctorius Marx 270]
MTRLRQVSIPLSVTDTAIHICGHLSPAFDNSDTVNQLSTDSPTTSAQLTTTATHTTTLTSSSPTSTTPSSTSTSSSTPSVPSSTSPIDPQSFTSSRLQAFRPPSPHPLSPS